MKELIDALENLANQESQLFVVILKNFIRITASGTFLMAFALLFVIYSRSRKSLYTVNVSGIIFIMFGVLLWCSMAASKLFFIINNDDFGISIFFSTFNNGFLIASLPFIGNGFLWIRKIKLFRNRLVWVISALILCMTVNLLLISIGKINPEFSQQADIIFSIVSMLLFGYAAFTSFKSAGTKILSLIIVAIPPLGYAFLQVLINYTPLDNISQFWFFRGLITVITNSAMAGMLILTSLNVLLSNLEELLIAERNKRKKLEEQLVLSETKNNSLLAETERLNSLVSEKENTIQTIKLQAGQTPESILLHSIKIGFDKNSIDKYVITLTFVLGSQEFTVNCANNKLTVPHSHWIIFAIARKKGITLKHPDIAQTKFQMIKYANSFTGQFKVIQEHVFRNNGGEFDLSIDQSNIEIENIKGYSNNAQLLETYKKFWLCFNIPGGAKSSSETLHNSLLALLS